MARSWHKSYAIVRATSEVSARVLAVKHFDQAARVVHRGDTAHNPWDMSAVVSCEEDRTSAFSREGPESVLHPHGD